MKPVLVTGALGSVGIPTVQTLLSRGIPVRILELPTKANRRKQRKFISGAECVWGDIRDRDTCRKAVSGCQAVIHLAAIIPPRADRDPETAYAVNVTGTAFLAASAAAQNPPCRFVFSSSVAVYGDRLKQPLIRTGDPLSPSPGDHYAEQKIEAESSIRKACPDWTIFRLSYIPVLESLKFDPLMFAMPLDTSLEICDPRDAGRALASAALDRESSGRIYLLAGGESCRTTYREYLGRILKLLGLGRKPLPDRLFGTEGFHCGFMEAEETENRFRFQMHTLTDFFRMVESRCRIRRFFITLVRPLARRWLVTLGESRN